MLEPREGGAAMIKRTVAKYRGTCRSCNAPVEKGEVMYFVMNAPDGRKVICDVCFGKDEDDAPPVRRIEPDPEPHRNPRLPNRSRRKSMRSRNS